MFKGSPHGIHNYVHFWSNNLKKGMNPFIPTSYGFNSTITALH